MASKASAEASLSGDEKAMKQILDTHAPDGTKLDVKALLSIVTNILNRASHIVDGAIAGNQEHLEKVKDKPYQLDFEASIIEKLSCEMMCSCKASDHVNLHDTTSSMFRKLSRYSWDAKVVLALSAYAVNYGDFWLLEQLYPKDQLARAVAVLKGMSPISKPTDPLKSRLVEINNLTKTILEVTECIVETEKLLAKNTLKYVPALAEAMDEIPKAVYLTIKTVIACASQITSLSTTTTDEFRTPSLLLILATELNTTLGSLKFDLGRCNALIVDYRYQALVKLIMTSTSNVEVLKAIIHTKDNMLIYLSTKGKAKIDDLSKKDVLLLISGLDISIETITTLKQTYNERVQEKKWFEVVWIPVVEQWSEDSQASFKKLKAMMPWYTVHNLSATDSVVLKLLKQEWNYQGKLIVPILSSQAKFEYQNALHIIHIWGIKAYPFTHGKQMELWEEHKTISSNLIFGNICSDEVNTWIKTGQVILFYGGTKTEWMKKLKERAGSFLKGIKKEVKQLNIDHGHAGFWGRVESLLMSKMDHASGEVDEALHELLNLVGYQKEQNWGMLCIGSKVLFSGLGDTVLEVLSQDTSKWNAETDLGMAIMEWHERVTFLDPKCFCYALPATAAAGKVPEALKCWKCTQVMERFVTFRCCHKDKGAPANSGSC